jgi:hypothetical protein
VPGECPTGRRSLAGGPRHTPARLGTCWEAARTPHTQHAETLPWRRALRDPWDGAGVMDAMEVDLPLPVGSARESIWEVASALTCSPDPHAGGPLWHPSASTGLR